MLDLNSYLPKAEEVAALIDEFMLDELHLAAPASYELNGRGERVYLVASYDPLQMGRSLRVYEHPEVARRLRMALGMPVTITKQTGTHYVVLMHGALSLPKVANFPTEGMRKDVFRLGLGLTGEIRLHARELRNGMIGAGQGTGKSNILHLLSGQMVWFQWQLYLADPQAHTFNPDVWNKVAAMPVAQSHADMLKVLDAIESEMADRVLTFRRAASMGVPPDDIDVFNTGATVPMPRMGFLIDEANFFLSNKAIFNRLADLLRQGRKWGLHIWVAGHEWHKENVPASVNDLLQTRIALSSLSGAVVLRSNRWGKWVEGRVPGRGVLRTNRFEPMQFYKVESGKWTVESEDEVMSQIASPIPAREAELVRRALEEADGKMSRELLMQWGLSQEEARDLGARYERRGWLYKDPQRGNARFVADELIALLDDSATNPPTPPTPPTAENSHQRSHQPPPTAVQTTQTQFRGE